MRQDVSPRLHPLSLDRLVVGLRQPGCPICNQMESATSPYLRSLIREHKNADGVWGRLQRTWGLCRQHTRGMLAQEPSSFPGLGTATLYRWLADALLEKARRSRFTPAEFRTLLRPEGMCLACEQLGDYQRAVVQTLVRALEAREMTAIKKTYFEGEGLCLPHLRLGLGVVDNRETAAALVEHFLKGVEAVARDLETFLASPPAATAAPGEAPGAPAWERAVERFSGRLGS